MCLPQLLFPNIITIASANPHSLTSALFHPSQSESEPERAGVFQPEKLREQRKELSSGPAAPATLSQCWQQHRGQSLQSTQEPQLWRPQSGQTGLPLQRRRVPPELRRWGTRSCVLIQCCLFGRICPLWSWFCSCTMLQLLQNVSECYIHRMLQNSSCRI